jgi:vacuolar protein sorting-associated protein 33A
MKFIASQIKNDEPKGLQREYFLYFVPRRTVACEKVSVILFMFELIH